MVEHGCGNIFLPYVTSVDCSPGATCLVQIVKLDGEFSDALTTVAVKTIINTLVSGPCYGFQQVNSSIL